MTRETPPAKEHGDNGDGGILPFLDGSKDADQWLNVKIKDQIRGSNAFDNYVKALAGNMPAEQQEEARKKFVQEIKETMEFNNVSFNDPATDRNIKKSNPNAITGTDIGNEMELQVVEAARMERAKMQAKDALNPRGMPSANSTVTPLGGRQKGGAGLGL